MEFSLFQIYFFVNLLLSLCDEAWKEVITSKHFCKVIEFCRDGSIRLLLICLFFLKVTLFFAGLAGTLPNMGSGMPGYPAQQHSASNQGGPPGMTPGQTVPPCIPPSQGGPPGVVPNQGGPPGMAPPQSGPGMAPPPPMPNAGPVPGVPVPGEISAPPQMPPTNQPPTPQDQQAELICFD